MKGSTEKTADIFKRARGDKPARGSGTSTYRNRGNSSRMHGSDSEQVTENVSVLLINSGLN